VWVCAWECACGCVCVRVYVWVCVGWEWGWGWGGSARAFVLGCGCRCVVVHVWVCAFVYSLYAFVNLVMLICMPVCVCVSFSEQTQACWCATKKAMVKNYDKNHPYD